MIDDPNDTTPSAAPDGDARLVRLLRDMADDYNVPSAPPPLEAMWTRIEGTAFPARVTPIHRRAGRILRWLPVAAALVLGIGIGQWNAGRSDSDQAAYMAQGETEASPHQPSVDAAFTGVASDYLEHTTALLVTLTSQARQGRPVAQAAPQARELLATTRLLLDATELSDPAVRSLLEDLELILAQIVRLPSEAPSAPESRLIRDAVDQRDVIPRLQLVLADARNTY